MKYYSKSSHKGFTPEGTDSVGESHTIVAKKVGGKNYEVEPTEKGFIVVNKKLKKQLGIFECIDYEKNKQSFIAKNGKFSLVCEIATGRVFATKNTTTFGVIILDGGQMYQLKGNGSIGDTPLSETAYLDDDGYAIFSGGNLFTRGVDGELNMMDPITNEYLIKCISDDPNAKIEKLSVNGQESDFFLISDKDEKAIFIPPQQQSIEESVGEIYKVGAGQEISVASSGKNKFDIVCYDPNVDATKVMLNRKGKTKIVEIDGKLVRIEDDGYGNIKIYSTGVQNMGSVMDVWMPVEEPAAVVEETVSVEKPETRKEYDDERLALAEALIQEERAKQEAEQRVREEIQRAREAELAQQQAQKQKSQQSQRTF